MRKKSVYRDILSGGIYTDDEIICTEYLPLPFDNWYLDSCANRDNPNWSNSSKNLFAQVEIDGECGWYPVEEVYVCDTCEKYFSLREINDDRSSDFPAIRCTTCYEIDGDLFEEENL